MAPVDLIIAFSRVNVIIEFEEKPLDINQWLEDNYKEDPYEFTAKVCKHPVAQIGVILKND